MGRYDDFSLNSGQYTPQYAGSPLEEVQKTSQALQDRHYRNIADLSNLELLKQQYASKVTPGAKDYINTQFTDIDQTLKDIAANGAENSTAKIAALRNKFLGDQGVLGALQVSEGIKHEVEQENELRVKGQEPIRMPGVREAAINTPVIDPTTGRLHELYTRPYQSTVAPRIDPNDTMAKIWNEVKPDSIEGELKGMGADVMAKLLKSAKSQNGEEADIPLFFESITRSGITSDKIKQNLKGALASYKESPAYKQAVQYSKDPEAETKRQEKLFLERGLLNVYNNLSREDKFVPRGARGSGTTAPDGSVTVPAPAMVRTLDQNNFTNPGDITSKGVKNGAISTSLNWLTNEAVSMFKDLTMQSTPESRKEANDRRHELLNGDNIDTEKTKQAVNDFRTVMEVVGTGKVIPSLTIGKSSGESSIHGRKSGSSIEPQDMTDDEVLQMAVTPEGQKMMKAYQAQYEQIRYNMPFIKMPVDEEVRQANEDYIRGTMDDRQILDPTTGKVANMRDENGEINSDFEELHKALVEKKAIFNGKFTPQNLYTQMPGSSKNFVRPVKVTIPNKDGTSSKEYILSEVPTMTSSADITENVLWNGATKKPGAEVDLGQGIKVKALVTPQQKAAVFKKYGAKWALDHPNATSKGALTQEDFIGGQGVLVTINGEVYPFASYTNAAQYLTQSGITLQ